MTLIRLRLLSRPSTNNRRQKRVRCYVNWTMTGTAPCLLTRIRHALRHPVSAFAGPGPEAQASKRPYSSSEPLQYGTLTCVRLSPHS
jgi:hypothetical protein